MHIHEVAFWFCAFFLLGIFFISIFGQFLPVLFLAMLSGLYLFFFRKYYLAALSILIVVGGLYFLGFDYRQSALNMPFDSEGQFFGVITKVEKFATRQKLIIELQDPYDGRLQVYSRLYPSFNYGDLINFEGVIKRPDKDFLNFYKKENIAGIANYPKIELVESGHGSFAKSQLLNLKEKIIASYQRNLSLQKAAFLAGVTLGERQEFSKEFEEKMSLSGTTHLVALSGYNISVIAIATGILFGAWFSRSLTFYFTVMVIMLFVLMTGGEASIIRAAIMGIIALLAKEAERLYSMRNAIVIAAFLMVLFNPRVLVFDLGFQLSFAALLGIVYLMPVLQKTLKVADKGFLEWKENALTTVAAQLAVVPFLLGNFGVFSFASFAANILILSAMPITMALGFLMGSLGIFSEFLARIAGFAVNVLLTYELWIIDVFSKITLPVAMDSFGFIPAILYYLVLLSFIYKFK